MRSNRSLESWMLGYRIERLEERDDPGGVRAISFEVLCPRSGTVLGSFTSPSEAKRYVLVHELRIIRQGTQRLNKDVRSA